MTQVNPPFLLKKLRPMGELSREFNNYLTQLERIVEQVYRRGGGTTDNTNTGLMFATSSSSDSGVTSKTFNPVSTSIDYTALPYDFINAKSSAQITFPKYPDVDSVIIIRNGDGSSIKLDGNGRKINGSYTGFINTNGASIKFYYFQLDNEWYAS